MNVQFMQCDAQCEVHIQKSQFSGTQFERCSFGETDFSGSTFSYCTMQLCQFFGSDFEDVTIETSVAHSCGFNEIKFNNARFIGLRSSFSRFRLCEWENAYIRESEFLNCSLQGTHLSEAKVTDTSFPDCQFDDKTEWPVGLKPPANAFNEDEAA
jgi:uncharacterized protein YjbI with pentapeptide repeats